MVGIGATGRVKAMALSPGYALARITASAHRCP